MIEFIHSDGTERDKWLATEVFSINIQESGHDGSIRVEIILGDHLGKSMGSLTINAPREPEPEPTPKEAPYQQRAVNAVLESGVSKKVLAIMMDSCERSITYWAAGKPINGPNLRRLEDVVDALNVSVPQPLDRRTV
mgnify:CR=1 FL=1|tara:strand:+ start:17511 stop:17921 length:411 start_codon:yes stop_codon:yes gene_type:complete